ncbi:arylsulfatase [Chryseolinea sp. T2]|uniref:sulfatase family protein n=1 Tax=Chryseolinea sp. T2 TaxID=3129255 RepID=UPI003076AC55
MKLAIRILHTIIILISVTCTSWSQKIVGTPNIVLIYTDDVGYGDIGANGAKTIATPNIDRLATSGVRFTQAYATSATCTPSRYSLLTGTYAWRKRGTGIAPGNAALLIPTNRTTLPSMLQRAGYTTGVVGKWHLGLGPQSGPDWNGDIKPGPLEIGFNYSFLIPATGDRVPCVYVENHRVVNLDPADPIKVSYGPPLNDHDATGKSNPELLKMKFSHGHDQTIVNGVSRIGYMTGGKSALWVDEDMADVITKKAVDFIDLNKSKKFFLYFSTHDIHVPRMPNKRFAGKSGMGPRGDAILQLDSSVGDILDALARNNLMENTLIIFTSDNGPVIDDGYIDEAVAKLGDHKAAGPLRGGKYSAFEGGTRVPFIVSWKGTISPGKVSNALFSQIDFYASFAALTQQKVSNSDSLDSKNYLNTLLNKKPQSREYVVQQSLNSTLSLIVGNWKYIEPSEGPVLNKDTNTELGNSRVPQLYNLKEDIGEVRNLAEVNKDQVVRMKAILDNVKINR